MSGGAYNYAYCRLEDLAEEIKQRDDHKALRYLVSDYLKRLADICRTTEWIDSGDCGEEEWKNAEEKLKSLSQKEIGDAVKIKKFDLIKKIVEETAHTKS